VTFFPLPDFVQQITHIALSPNKKTLFVCEQHHPVQGQESNQDVFLSIYDLRNPEQPRVLKAHVNISDLITLNHNAMCSVNAQTGAIALGVIKESTKVPQKPGTKKGGQFHYRHCS
jgi:hypothetical protein